MPRIRFTSSAEADLLELWLNIAEENPVAADESLDSIQATVSLLGTQPEMGRARPELADGLRSFPTRTPYIIFYVPDGDDLLVVRVLHHARDIDVEYFS
ncbi:MAG: type II toxin-antitoxin system RelE/ParE family toxin [Nitrosomonadales bacterium]|nr:type II toxin-antitoxin system RelE/ParE family toxin [Nitrosomonadales bacterium]